jgi:hypothetical protein
MDAGSSVAWTTATWNANLPAGTSLIVETSTGNTAIPDSTWSGWSAVAADGTITSPAGQYIHYRFTLKSNDASVTPTVFDITLNYK